MSLESSHLVGIISGVLGIDVEVLSDESVHLTPYVVGLDNEGIPLYELEVFLMSKTKTVAANVASVKGTIAGSQKETNLAEDLSVVGLTNEWFIGVKGDYASFINGGAKGNGAIRMESFAQLGHFINQVNARAASDIVVEAFDDLVDSDGYITVTNQLKSLVYASLNDVEQNLVNSKNLNQSAPRMVSNPEIKVLKDQFNAVAQELIALSDLPSIMKVTSQLKVLQAKIDALPAQVESTTQITGKVARTHDLDRMESWNAAVKYALMWFVQNHATNEGLKATGQQLIKDRVYHAIKSRPATGRDQANLILDNKELMSQL